MTQDISPDFSDSRAKHSQDEALDLKKRARRRLVGAIALVLLMLALLPMVLDDKQHKPAPQEIAISIPSQDDAGFSSKVIPVAPPATSETSLPDTSLTRSQTQTTLPASTPPTEKIASASVDKLPNTNGKPDQPSSPGNKPSPNENLAVPASGTTVSEQQTKAVVPEKAPPEKTRLEKIPVQKAPVEQKKAEQKQKPPTSKLVEAHADSMLEHSASAGKVFMVQVGVFSDAAKVAEIQKKLQAHDVSATQTEKIMTDKGEKIRLRTSHVADRQEAERILAKVQAAGYSGMVVSK